MSYLDVPRLHFAGVFQADTSSVNNRPQNYDTSTFTDACLEPVHDKGGWNPMGTGAFRFKQCSVTSVVYRDGTRCASSDGDSLVGALLHGADQRVAAKLVDLHPLEQGVPEVWGMRVVIGRARHTLVHGGMVPPAAGDIWYRVHPATKGDPWLSAAFQAVLQGLWWGHEGASRFLDELRDASPDELSIKFNLDGFDNERTSPSFSHGRVVGTIGPSAPSEPRHFVLGRHLKREPPSGQDDDAQLHGSPPASPMFSAPCRVDERRRKVVLDLGNSLATTAPGGAILPAFEGIELAVLPDGAAALPLGRIDCLAEDWYARTAGVLEAPARRELSDEELAAMAHAPLGVVRIGDGKVEALLREASDGIDVRPDQRVFRLNPGDTARAEFWATRFGAPVGGMKLKMERFGEPASGLKSSPSAVTDARGRAPIRLEGGNPGKVNAAVDGQVYFVEWADDPDAMLVNSLCIRVFDEFEVGDDPTWEDIREVMVQYANLYPVMKRIVDLGDEENVLRHRDTLIFALSLPVEDPNHMPVTRDLSRKKREAILGWLARTHPAKRVVVARRSEA